jgi:hypothetical protein
MGLCKCIQEDWVEFAKKNANRLPNGREDSIEVSNLGNVSLNTLCGGWNVKGLWFAQGRKVTGPALTFTMVSSMGGLKAVLSAVPQTFNRDSVVAIGKELEADLIALVGIDAESQILSNNPTVIYPAFYVFLVAHKTNKRNLVICNRIG